MRRVWRSRVTEVYETYQLQPVGLKHNSQLISPRQTVLIGRFSFAIPPIWFSSSWDARMRRKDEQIIQLSAVHHHLGFGCQSHRIPLSLSKWFQFRFDEVYSVCATAIKVMLIIHLTHPLHSPWVIVTWDLLNPTLGVRPERLSRNNDG